jgi:hypothetical protein
MIKKDNTVKLDNMHPAIWEFLMELDVAWRKAYGYELTITSGKDGRHSFNSRHYLGTAEDIRTWTTATSGIQMKGTQRKQAFKLVQDVLGSHWFTLDEGDHFHIDFRPHYKT